MAHNNRREFLKKMGLGSLALATSKLQGLPFLQDKDERPNILFIMTDDHASRAMSCYGSEMNETPNIDRIAQEGIKLDNCFCTNSICGPSRATILTGKYSHKNGFKSNKTEAFDGSQQTLPKILRQNGYETAMIGKWHLRSEPTGFDYYKVLPGQGKYFSPEFIKKGEWPNTVEEEGYVTDVITDETIEWLENRNNNNPFFLMSHHKAPHRPWRPDQKHWDKFKNKHIPAPADLLDEWETKPEAVRKAQMTLEKHMHPLDTGGSPPDSLQGDELTQWRYQHFMRRYLACVASVDDNIGRLLDYLEQNGLKDNTIVVYTSDQGFFLGDHGFFDKRIMYEESLRMPFLMRYPDKIKAGQESDAIVINEDFAPTFLDYAGIKVPSDIQGRSFRTVCQGNTPEDWREAMYYHYYGYPDWHMVDKHYGIRTKKYKLIHYYGYTDEWAFYDLEADPEEQWNLYGKPQYENIINKMKEKLYELMDKYDETKPTPGQVEEADTTKY